MGLVRRKKRTPEQIAATNAKRAATIAAKKGLNEVIERTEGMVAAKVEANAETLQPTETKQVDVTRSEVDTEPNSADVSVKPLPKKIQDRIEAMAGIQDDLAQEIKEFKSGEAYLEGDLPITLHGLSGPGFSPGQRSLNFIDEKCLDPLYHFRWSHKSMVDFHRADGYEPSNHGIFSRMMTARGGGHSFGKTPEDYVYSGDLILIQISKDRHDLMAAANVKKTAAKEGRAKNNVYAKGEKLGVDVYEGGDAMSPRMENLMRFLEKELGPGAREAFLGG